MGKTYAVGILLHEKAKLVESLKKNKTDEVIIKRIGEINKAIKWLNKIAELELDDVSKYDITKLPDMKTGYSEFRLMNDCETDNIEYWVEFKDHPGLTTGDFVVSRKA